MEYFVTRFLFRPHFVVEKIRSMISVIEIMSRINGEKNKTRVKYTMKELFTPIKIYIEELVNKDLYEWINHINKVRNNGVIHFQKGKEKFDGKEYWLVGEQLYMAIIVKLFYDAGVSDEVILSIINNSKAKVVLHTFAR